ASRPALEAGIGAGLEREVFGRDVARDLGDRDDHVIGERFGVFPDRFLAWRAVDAVRLHTARVVEDDVAVLPDDLGHLLDEDSPRFAADLRHVLVLHTEEAFDDVAWPGQKSTRSRSGRTISGE